MVRVRGGVFRMGATGGLADDAYDDEFPVHRVSVRDFYIARFEVTQALWQAIMGTSVSAQRDKADTSWALYGVGPNFPMYYVSWNDCQAFVKKLRILTGKSFRLPTEAEWEYAARGGARARHLRFSGSDNPDSVAWHSGNYASQSRCSYLSGGRSVPDSVARRRVLRFEEFSHEVGEKSPNELGLYDMSGNVWEWCTDRYSRYHGFAQRNPQGPDSGSERVLRGGAWYFVPRASRVSNRYHASAGYRDCHFGFRLAL